MLPIRCVQGVGPVYGFLAGWLIGLPGPSHFFFVVGGKEGRREQANDVETRVMFMIVLRRALDLDSRVAWWAKKVQGYTRAGMPRRGQPGGR